MGIIQRQGIKASIVTYIGVAIGYLNFVLLYPKFLLPDQVGLVRVLIAASVIFSYASLLGSPYALVRFFPYFKNKEQKHHGFLTLILLIAIAGFIFFSIVILIFKQPIVELYEKKSALFAVNFEFLFPITFFFALAELLYQYCRSLLKNVVPAVIREVVVRLIQTLAIVLYILKVIDFDWLLYFLAGSYFIQLISLTLYLIFLKQFFFFTKIELSEQASLKSITRFTLFMFVSSLATVYNVNADTVMLGALSGLTDTAVYAIAFFIGTLIQIPARTMNFIAVSIVADAWRHDDRKKIQLLYTQTSLNQMIIGGFIFLLIWANTDLLLSFLPPVFAEAKWVIFIIGIGKLFDMATGINGEILSVSRHVKVNLITNLFLIVITTASNYILIKAMGIKGAALATVLSLLVYNLIRMTFLWYQYRLQPFNINTLKAFILLLVCFLIYYLLPQFESEWFNAVYLFFILSGVFIIPLILFKISPEIYSAYREYFSSGNISKN